MKRLAGVLFSLLLPGMAHAFFCPTNFSQINIGDTLDHIKQQCGKPDKEEMIDDAVSEPQEWNYYLPQAVQINTVDTPIQGSMKVQFSFNLAGNIINMSVNGIGVGATTICNGQYLALGDNKDKVEAACGKPAITVKANDKTPQTPPKLTVIYYGKTKFTFRNNQLITD